MLGQQWSKPQKAGNSPRCRTGVLTEHAPSLYLRFLDFRNIAVLFPVAFQAIGQDLQQSRCIYRTRYDAGMTDDIIIFLKILPAINNKLKGVMPDIKIICVPAFNCFAHSCPPFFKFAEISPFG